MAVCVPISSAGDPVSVFSSENFCFVNNATFYGKHLSFYLDNFSGLKRSKPWCKWAKPGASFKACLDGNWNWCTWVWEKGVSWFCWGFFFSFFWSFMMEFLLCAQSYYSLIDGFTTTVKLIGNSISVVFFHFFFFCKLFLAHFFPNPFLSLLSSFPSFHLPLKRKNKGKSNTEGEEIS